MIEAFAATVEKVAEASVEKAATFFDKLESSVEVTKSEIEQKTELVKKFWDDLEQQADAQEITRPLTDEERAYYKEKLGCSDHLLENATIDENGKIHVKTINEGKEGQEGENGVKYERKTVTVNGVKLEGVFPEFDSIFDTQLPEDLLQDTDLQQMDYCNQQLKERLENTPEFAKQFSSEQAEQIKDGQKPDGYTWHHNEEQGKMELVRSDDHVANRHTGGKAIWGGGKENR